MPSSVIFAMHYEPQQRELVIVFRGGRGAYRYFDVPPEEWAAFREAESKGMYLNEIFKARGYRYERSAAVVANGQSKEAGDASLSWGEHWALRKPAASQRAWREEEAAG